MNQILGDVKDTVKGFFFAYAVKRSLTETLSFLSEDIRWIGSGALPAAKGKRQVEQVLEAEFSADSTSFNIEYKVEETRSCGVNTAESFFEIELNKTHPDGERVSLTVQLSAVCRLEGFLYKICTLHTTGIDNLAEEKEWNSAKTAEKAFSEWQNRFHETSMDFLQQSIPGGIIGCYMEPGYPLYFINNRMLSYLGYTEEELSFETEGYISRCIHPDDLTFVENFMDQRLRQGDEYEIRYRMMKKNKTAIWVVERGRKAVNDVGRPVVMRVLFDITETVVLQQQMQDSELSLQAANQQVEDLSHTPLEGQPACYCSDTDMEELRAREQEQKRQHHFLSLLSTSLLGGMLITHIDAQRTFSYVGDGLLCNLGSSEQELRTETKDSFVNLMVADDRENARHALEEQLERGSEYELEYRVKKPNDNVVWMQEKGTYVVSDEEEPMLISVVQDITQRKLIEQESLHKTRSDTLTGLLNQDYARQSIRAYLEHKPEAIGATLMLLDLDNFKQINEIYGHWEGDKVLIRVAQLLKKLFHQDEIVGRLDSDKFVVLLKTVESEKEAEEQAALVCSRIRETFEQYFANCQITISVGAAIACSGEKISLRQLYKTADEALYQAKFSGKDQYCILDKNHLAHMGQTKKSEGTVKTNEAKQSLDEGLSSMSGELKKQWIAWSLFVLIFVAMAAGILWMQFQRSPQSLVFSEGLFGVMGIFMLTGGLLLARIHKRTKRQVETVMSQCRQMLSGEDFSGQSEPEDMEVMAEALHTYQLKMEEATCLDPLLKIGNRAKAAKDVGTLVEDERVQHIALFLLDIQEFSRYNDVFSIRTGDEIIKEVRHRLGKYFGEHLYRIDGDVFLGVVTENRDDQIMLDQIEREMEKPICTNNVEIKIQYNLGISHYPDHGENAVELLERAQSAVNYAKKQTTLNTVIYSESITSLLRREGEILSLLRKRIAEDLLEVWYQPIYDTVTQQFTTAEALLRLRDDGGGFIEPYHAILVAEKNDAIGEIGEYVLRATCQTMQELERIGSTVKNIHVNLSVQQVAQPNFAEHTLELIRQAGAKPSQIGVEVTETALIQSFDSTVESLVALKNAGAQIALDDFGSGYSSLNYLARLPIDRLKLDRQLVLQVNEGAEQLEFVQTIVHMAKIKNMKVIAEGVEDADMLAKIISCGADYIQGFYFSKPLPKDEFIRFVQNKE